MAEEVSTVDAVHMFRLRYGGMLLRALDAELAAGNLQRAVRTARARMACSPALCSKTPQNFGSA